MRTLLIVLCVLWFQHTLFGQFPYTRTIEIRSGQQRPSITAMVQDGDGLFWLASDIGLLQTDGDRVEVMVRAEQGRVTALHASGHHVFAALEGGLIIRCDAIRCDTLMMIELLQDVTVNALLVDEEKKLWLASHGAGLLWVNINGHDTISSVTGLRDDHVNGLALIPGGRLVAATDQGLVICRRGEVIESFGEAEGAPDNLTISVAANKEGVIWAGTDRSGAFRWDIQQRSNQTGYASQWTMGEVTSIAVQGDLVWMGTAQGSVILQEPDRDEGYVHSPESGAGIRDIIIDNEGAAWWCDGTDKLYRADAAMLFVEEHEGVDMRSSTAICSDPNGSIWFATPEGLFHHAAAFTGDQQLTRIPFELDETTPIVSLAADSEGSVWAGTFGAGAIAIHADGTLEKINSSNSTLNDNVLSVKIHGNEVWFATLEGLAHYSRQDGLVSHPLPSPGFVFDLLSLDDGTILAATDGNGVLRFHPSNARWEVFNDGEGSYYSLVKDEQGRAWVAGPGTGICGVSIDGGTCLGTDRPPFDDELFALASWKDRLIAFGRTGTLVFEPRTAELNDVSSRWGLSGIQAELNAVDHGPDGAIWLATSRGLVRMRPSEWHFQERVRTVIRSFRSGLIHMVPDEEIELGHDHERITIRFAGIHWVDPGAVRFEHRLLGADQDGQFTRDREVSFADLSPGDYTFQVRAFTGNAPSREEWTSISFTVGSPIWERAWFILLLIVVLVGLLVLILKIRDRRLREKERMEQEKVRFQLEALRSQVDPHFLFNSFNTLVALIESDAERAVEHVEKLSLFFRNILQVRDKEIIPLGEELELLENYFALEQLRFGAAISLIVEVSEEDREFCIVPLTLQLLVENALKHNVATLEKPLQVKITSQVGELTIRNRMEARLSAPRSTGFGLDSIQKRYKALSPKAIRMDRSNEHFTVTIPLLPPQHEGTDH